MLDNLVSAGFGLGFAAAPKVLGDLFEAIAGAVLVDCGGDLETLWKVTSDPGTGFSPSSHAEAYVHLCRLCPFYTAPYPAMSILHSLEHQEQLLACQPPPFVIHGEVGRRAVLWVSRQRQGLCMQRCRHSPERGSPRQRRPRLKQSSLVSRCCSRSCSPWCTPTGCPSTRCGRCWSWRRKPASRWPSAGRSARSRAASQWQPSSAVASLACEPPTPCPAQRQQGHRGRMLPAGHRLVQSRTRPKTTCWLQPGHLMLMTG